MEMSGKVILLNGCSSAGKTTLAREIQSVAEDPWQYIGLDQFRDGLPPSLRGLNSLEDEPGSQGLNVIPVMKNGLRVTQIKFGDFGKKILRAMRRTVAEIAASGCSVIVDDILLEREFVADYSLVLDTNKTWLISVKCDLNKVIEREAKRPGRFPGTAESHYDLVYQSSYLHDLEVDTGIDTPRDAAIRVLNEIKLAPTALGLFDPETYLS